MVRAAGGCNVVLLRCREEEEVRVRRQWAAAGRGRGVCGIAGEEDVDTKRCDDETTPRQAMGRLGIRQKEPRRRTGRVERLMEEDDPSRGFRRGLVSGRCDNSSPVWLVVDSWATVVGESLEDDSRYQIGSKGVKSKLIVAGDGRNRLAVDSRSRLNY